MERRAVGGGVRGRDRRVPRRRPGPAAGVPAAPTRAANARAVRVEVHYPQRTRFESIAERKLRRRQLTKDGNVEISEEGQMRAAADRRGSVSNRPIPDIPASVLNRTRPTAGVSRMGAYISQRLHGVVAERRLENAQKVRYGRLVHAESEPLRKAMPILLEQSCTGQLVVYCYAQRARSVP
jgi:hypothetical protein